MRRGIGLIGLLWHMGCQYPRERVLISSDLMSFFGPLPTAYAEPPVDVISFDQNHTVFE